MWELSLQNTCVGAHDASWLHPLGQNTGLLHSMLQRISCCDGMSKMQKSLLLTTCDHLLSDASQKVFPRPLDCVASEPAEIKLCKILYVVL
jgi:hypothetical protein